MTPREERHVPECNCDYDYLGANQWRHIWDPRCAALNEEGAESGSDVGLPQSSAMTAAPHQPNSHVSAPFRGVLNAWARGSK